MKAFGKISEAFIFLFRQRARCVLSISSLYISCAPLATAVACCSHFFAQTNSPRRLANLKPMCRRISSSESCSASAEKTVLHSAKERIEIGSTTQYGNYDLGSRQGGPGRFLRAAERCRAARKWDFRAAHPQDATGSCYNRPNALGGTL